MVDTILPYLVTVGLRDPVSAPLEDDVGVVPFDRPIPTANDLPFGEGESDLPTLGPGARVALRRDSGARDDAGDLRAAPECFRSTDGRPQVRRDRHPLLTDRRCIGMDPPRIGRGTMDVDDPTVVETALGLRARHLDATREYDDAVVIGAIEREGRLPASMALSPVGGQQLRARPVGAVPTVDGTAVRETTALYTTDE